jgi:hypothetical protein
MPHFLQLFIDFRCIMNRLFPLAGLLAVSLGTLVSHGAAKAATSGLCYFDNLGGTLPGTTCSDYQVELGDKRFVVKTPPNQGVGKVAFEASPASLPELYQVAIDWAGSGLAGSNSGDFTYTVEIIDGTHQFASIGLSTGGDYPSPGVDSTVTKEVRQGLSATGPVIDSVTSIDGGLSYSNPIGGTQIFVRDSWSVANGATIDNVSNYIRQTVPGPLPLLGVATALGMSRRLRRRLAQR